MIGDVPKNAPRRCKLGRHTGQERGGTMVFQCSRCGGSFWQTQDMSHVTAAADARIAAGDHSAVDWAHDEVRRITGGYDDGKRAETRLAGVQPTSFPFPETPEEVREIKRRLTHDPSRERNR